MICVTVREKFGLIVAIANAGTGGGFVVPRGSDDEQAAMDQAIDDIDLAFVQSWALADVQASLRASSHAPCSNRAFAPCISQVFHGFCGLSQLAINCSLR